MIVEDPKWIELSKESNMDELEKELTKFMIADKVIKHPTIVVFLQRNENSYSNFKNLMQTYRIPSQVI